LERLGGRWERLEFRETYCFDRGRSMGERNGSGVQFDPDVPIFHDSTNASAEAIVETLRTGLLSTRMRAIEVDDENEGVVPNFPWCKAIHGLEAGLQCEATACFVLFASVSWKRPKTDQSRRGKLSYSECFRRPSL
jgi:hypothetical protein